MATRDDEIREEVLHADTINTGFHVGGHPQRPIPPDLTDGEKTALERERRSLAHHRPGTPAPTGFGTGQPMASVPVDPDRPNKGVLYTGPSAEEELSLRTGRPIKEVEEIMAAPAKRAEEAQAEQKAARESKRAPKAEERKAEPPAARKPD
jgi:hypothetical protein